MMQRKMGTQRVVLWGVNQSVLRQKGLQHFSPSVRRTSARSQFRSRQCQCSQLSKRCPTNQKSQEASCCKLSCCFFCFFLIHLKLFRSCIAPLFNQLSCRTRTFALNPPKGAGGLLGISQTWTRLIVSLGVFYGGSFRGLLNPVQPLDLFLMCCQTRSS